MRGLVNTPIPIEKTLENLNLRRKYNASIVKEDSQTLGMLKKVKDMVAWKSVDDSIIKELLEKRGKVNGLKNLTMSTMPSKYKTLDDIAKSIYENNLSLSDIKDLKPWFTLNPPRGGFKRKTKTQFSQKGILGENKELHELVRRMI